MTLFDNIMGPLDKSYCVITYGLGLLVLFLAILNLLGGLYILFFKSGTKNNKTYYLGGIATIFYSLLLFLSYYLYRIIYNICIKIL